MNDDLDFELTPEMLAELTDNRGDDEEDDGPQVAMMAMSVATDSPLVCYTAISPNSNPRTQPITKITPHHMAGVLTVEQCGRVFASPSRQASSNYGIDSDGRIALYVPESRRSWASSSSWNDQRAVTIEVSDCEAGGDWPVSDKAWRALVDLCVDVCQRNGIPELSYTGDSSGSLTEHNMYAATACPGPYLGARMQQLADEVNARLRGEEMTDEEREWLRVVYEQQTGTYDPTGRDVALNDHDHIKWIGAKVSDIEAKLDALIVSMGAKSA